MIGLNGLALADKPTPLQPLVDALEPGGVLMLEPGVYAGPVIVEDDITIDGQHHATIDGLGKSSVIFLDTDGATIKNLRIVEFRNVSQ